MTKTTTRSPDIKFVRVERDCRHNKGLRTARSNRGIIYDYDVIIHGEHRARMRSSFERGYHVQDADDRAIDPPMMRHSTGRAVNSKSEFLTVISELLAAGKIPTMEEMAAMREKEAQVKHNRIASEKERLRLGVLACNACGMFDTIKSMIAASVHQNPAMLAAQKLLAEIDAKITKQVAEVDADPGRFHIY
jgi:hypothetical protein